MTGAGHLVAPVSPPPAQVNNFGAGKHMAVILRMGHLSLNIFVNPFSIPRKGDVRKKEMFLENRYLYLLWWDGLMKTEKYCSRIFLF